MSQTRADGTSRRESITRRTRNRAARLAERIAVALAAEPAASAQEKLDHKRTAISGSAVENERTPALKRKSRPTQKSPTAGRAQPARKPVQSTPPSSSKNPTTTTTDIPVAELLGVIRKLPASLPLTDEYEEGASGDVWYRTQKEHLVGWLEEYDSPGAYKRANPSVSSRRFYNSFKCVAGLIWLAEALGEDPAVLTTAIADVENAGTNLASQCGAFRKHVPWKRIHQLARAGSLRTT